MLAGLFTASELPNRLLFASAKSGKAGGADLSVTTPPAALPPLLSPKLPALPELPDLCFFEVADLDGLEKEDLRAKEGLRSLVRTFG